MTSGSVAALTPAKTDTFTYRSSGWKGQLTAYNGQNITYDGMGNPTSYRGMAMEWKKGRQLSKITKADGTVLNFAYDSEGNRVRKTVGGVTTQYYLSGGQIVGMKQGTDVMQFVYDPDGQPFMMRLNGTDYYYTYNVQGDVVSLIDRSNTRVVEYQYDSWGKPTLISDTSADFVMISQKSLPVRE